MHRLRWGDEFWATRLPPSRKGTPWLHVLQTLVAYRLIDPGSEWRLHRHWFDVSAMADLLGGDFTLAQKNTLYRCLDKLVAHKDELFKHLSARWGDLFDAKFDVLLYDLTSTYFESDTLREESDKRQYGYSRDKRFDCRQVVIGLIVTPEGFPLGYEVLAGNTQDSTTLGDFLRHIEVCYGRANRIWVMDRGVPTEESLARMRAMGASYRVGTPKGRLTKLEQAFLSQPWQRVRDGIEVKRLAQDEDTYVLAQSEKRIDKEWAMRRRRLTFVAGRGVHSPRQRGHRRGGRPVSHVAGVSHRVTLALDAAAGELNLFRGDGFRGKACLYFLYPYMHTTMIDRT